MKNALFLGGSKGLGLELARLAVAEGYRVTIAARSVLDSPLYKEDRALAMPLDLEDDTIIPLTHLGPFDLIVWVAGRYQEKRLLDLEPEEIRGICRNHIEGPSMFLLPHLRKNRGTAHALRLIIVASSGSYRIRTGEGLYGPLKAAKAQLARTLGKEVPETIPGSKVLLANPGGMNTPFWEWRDRDVSSFMDPIAVARMIWDAMNAQIEPFAEIHIDRQPDGSPKFDHGPRLPC
jgi:NAD(P)-dependent dehydrogenase (short-subunit alcohol dehydrogenase family)